MIRKNDWRRAAITSIVAESTLAAPFGPIKATHHRKTIEHTSQ
jgi:hypothetical protein